MFKGLFMKNKLLAASLLSALAVPAFADDSNTDPQTVNITVPEVALLNVEDSDIALTLPALTEAGTGFPQVTSANAITGITTFDLSSNVSSSASPTLRTIEVAITGDLPTGSQLNITGSNAGTSATAVITDTGVTSGQTSIATDIGNLAIDDGSIEFKFGADTTGDDMIAYTDSDSDGTADAIGVTITYTLSDA